MLVGSAGSAFGGLCGLAKHCGGRLADAVVSLSMAVAALDAEA